MTSIEMILNQEIKSPIHQVWDALINPEKIKHYLFGTQTHCNWQVGSAIKFTGVWEGKIYEDKGTILAIEKEKIVSYSYWSSFSGVADLPENYQIVTFTLQNIGINTQITLRQQNIQSEEAKAHSIENWKMVLDGLRKLAEAD